MVMRVSPDVTRLKAIRKQVVELRYRLEESMAKDELAGSDLRAIYASAIELDEHVYDLQFDCSRSMEIPKPDFEKLSTTLRELRDKRLRCLGLLLLRADEQNSIAQPTTWQV
jgi:hypothetical protein